MPWRYLLLILCWLWLPTSQAQEPVLPLYYIDKPPYYFTHAQQPSGFLLARAMLILQTAGISSQPRERPAPRILHELTRDHAPFCSVGWFKTPEREAIAWFSEPIYQDVPMWLLVRQEDAGAMVKLKSLHTLLRAQYRIGVVSGFSYGAALDRQLDQTLVPVDRQAKSVEIAIGRLLARRVDAIIADRVETTYLLNKQDLPSEKLLAVRFADIPEGNHRYLMCSANLPSTTQQAINRAIAQLTEQQLFSVSQEPDAEPIP